MPVWQCQQKSPRRRSDSNISLRTTCQFGVKFMTSQPSVRKVRTLFSISVCRMNPWSKRTTSGFNFSFLTRYQSVKVESLPPENGTMQS